MTSWPTFKVRARWLAGATVIILFASGSAAFDCNSQCQNGLLFDKSNQQDKLLNVRYKQVMQRLNERQRTQLRSVQRQWISDRDSRCDKREEEFCADSGCVLGGQILGASNERLECLISMTHARVSELLKIQHAVEAGREPSFEINY